MNIENYYTLPGLLHNAVSKFGNRPAYSFVDGDPITYKEVNSTVNKLISFLEIAGIKKGDKIGILSSNMPNWGITYFAITSMGAVVVPMLPDFSKDEVSNVISHSDMKILFVSKSLQNKLTDSSSKILDLIWIIDDLNELTYNGISFQNSPEPTEKHIVVEDDLASIIYTSGTTGKSKGVMLSHKNICFTAEKGGKVQTVTETDRFLSVLPLSHTYENTLGLILPMLGGACVYYLQKAPTPAVLIASIEKGKTNYNAICTIDY